MIGSIIIGILAGFLAGKIMRGGGYGCVINLLLGIVGGFVGGVVFRALNIQWEAGWVGELGTAVIGAVLVLAIAGWCKKR